DQCAVRVGFSASVSPGASLPAGAVTFGLDASAGINVDSYRCFANGAATAPTILGALKTSISELVIPFQPSDVSAVPVGTVVTLGGRGSLRFSANANLLAVANPLATLTLPSPVPVLSVTQGTKVKVGAAWEIATEFQVRVQRVDAGRVRLGWYRK